MNNQTSTQLTKKVTIRVKIQRSHKVKSRNCQNKTKDRKTSSCELMNFK